MRQWMISLLYSVPQIHFKKTNNQTEKKWAKQKEKLLQNKYSASKITKKCSMELKIKKDLYEN